MNGLLQKAAKVNKNDTAINGRSIPYSNLSEEERAQLAADAVTGVRRFIPSIRQAAENVGITPAKVSSELNRRAARQCAEQFRRLGPES